MCTLHLIKPAIDVNSVGSPDVNMVKLTSVWYSKMYTTATDVLFCLLEFNVSLSQ